MEFMWYSKFSRGVFNSLCSCINISFAVLECMVSEQYYTGCGLWVTQFHLLKKLSERRMFLRRLVWLQTPGWPMAQDLFRIYHGLGYKSQVILYLVAIFFFLIKPASSCACKLIWVTTYKLSKPPLFFFFL